MAVVPSHLGICVTDLAASMRFYCDGLGFEPGIGYDLDSDSVPGIAESLEVASPCRMRSQMIQLGAMTVELLAYSAPAPFGQPSASRGQLGLTHLSFHVDDLDATLARLVEHGGTVQPSTRQNLGIELVFLTDPDGTRIELMARPG